MRLVVSGGGTAGHISPILATLDALKRQVKDLDVVYIGQANSLEARIATAAGLQFESIQAGKFRRYKNQKLWRKLIDLPTMALNARDVARAVRGLAQSRRLLKSYQPDVVFIKGGFVGLPVGLAAGQLGIPYLVHESDIVPGLTNRLLAKKAAKVAVGFPVEKYPGLPQAKLVFTGNPVREELLSFHRLDGLAAFKLDNALPVVLIIGGSSGSVRINNAVLEASVELTEKCQIIHITGEREIERVRGDKQRLQLIHPERYQVYAYLNETMGPALAAADIVISRAGANSLAELATLDKPTIVIPASQLRDQETNALSLARSGAIRVITEDKLASGLLAREVQRLIESPVEQKSLIKAFRTFSVPDATERLADLIVRVAEEGRG